MKNIFLFIFLFFSVSLFDIHAQCVTNVNFSTWQQGGQPSNGNWVLQNGGTQIHQTVNGAPTFFYTPFDMMNVHISGEFRSTDLDNDYLGFVFSFLNPLTATDSFDCWLFDWKQGQQGSAPSGMSLNRCNGIITPADYDPQFWNHWNSPSFTCVQNTFGGAGWQIFNWHSFDLYLTYTSARIYVDGNLIFDQQDCFKPGRFGFYNLSQEDCFYRNFQYESYVDFAIVDDKKCIGGTAEFQFINPCVPTFLNQYQSVTWNFGDGTSQTITNPNFNTINTTHVYNTAGNYTVTLSVLDYNGCSSSATKTIQIAQPITLTPTLNPPPCNGGNNGSISLTASGGFGNYQYVWNGGAMTTSTWNGIGAGTYVVTAFDGHCTTTAQYTLNQPTPLTATTSHVDAPCGSNGSATLSISGGTPPYNSVNWAGIPGNTASLPAGTWIANFLDANGCTALLQYTETITQLPCGITSSVNVTPVSCFGGNNGAVLLTVGGSAPPVNVSWSNGASGLNPTGFSAGTYTYSYSDANPAHSFTGTVTITQPGAALNAQLTTIGIACAGTNTGQAIASVSSGGSPPYNYTWSPTQPNNAVANGLSPGPVAVTVTDASGCSATSSGTISGAQTINLSFTSLMDSCFYGGNGRATVAVSGGNPPFSYNWNNFATTAVNDGIVAGTYTVTVTDNSGCTVSGSTTVIGPSAPLIQTSVVQPVACQGNNTGVYQVTPTGGTPGYTYVWSPNTITGNGANNLAAGIYSFTITDAYGCYIVGGDTIEEPDSLFMGISSHTDVSCPGGNNGTISVTLSGGTPPYTYLGNPLPPGTNTLPNLTAGTYTAVFTDAVGCTVTLTEIVGEPGPQSVQFASTDNPCFGASVGSLTASFVNATGTVGYVWGGGQTTATINGLAVGTYSVTATDQNNCSVSGSATVNQPAIVPLPVVATDGPCFGVNGSATANPGGTAPFTYAWSNGQSTATVSLPGGSYSVTSTDADNCIQTASVTINIPAQIPLNVAAADAPCFGANGTASANPAGTAPFTYAWSNGGNTAAVNLPAGSYTVTTTDIQNCVQTASVSINEPAIIPLDVVVTDAPCFGANGSATANPAGTAPFVYTWSAGGSTATVSLGAGSYAVTVSDVDGCVQSASLSINQAAAIQLTEVITAVSCFGGSDGQAVLTAAGGAGAPFGFAWNPAVSATNSATNLLAGQYDITITDAFGCTLDTFISVTQPAAPLALNPVANDISCFGVVDGSVQWNASGGTGSYSFSWTPNISNQSSASGLAAGTYDVLVADANGCTTSGSVAVIEPTEITFTQSQTDLTCYQDQSGQAAVVVSGGTLPYSYLWSSGGSTSDQAGGLNAGSYAVTITDQSQCSVTAGFTLTEPAQLLVSEIHTNNNCFGESIGSVTVTATGGTGSYAYSWNPNVSSTNQAQNLPAASYSITVSDAANCTASVTALVTEPNPITLQYSATNVSCAGVTNGTLTVSANGGSLPYSYSITPDGVNVLTSVSGQFIGLSAGNYAIVVTDANGCSVNASQAVSEPAAITLSVVSQDVNCFGDENGTITVQVAGGQPVYQFVLSSGLQNTTGLFTNLAPDTYTITVTDANNCSESTTALVNEPAPVSLTINPNPVEVPLGDIVSLQTTTNQSGLLQWDWSPALGLSCTNCPNPEFNGYFSANYQVVVTNEQGCTAKDTVMVEVIPNYNVFFPNVFSPNGDGANDIWKVFGNLATVKQIEIMVFNRWGEKVFQSNDINFGWDGSYKGDNAQQGVYTYMASIVWIDNHSDKNFRGSVTLLR